MSSESKLTVYSIGHSTHSTERLIGLLKLHDITAVADVRSSPYSRMNPQFNREAWQDALSASAIRYVFLGAELGARTQDRTCYTNGRVDYEKLAATAVFRRGIERILLGAKDYRIALMCAEKDPLECHRTLLVSRSLDDAGVNVLHILASGKIESHSEAMSRLMESLELGEKDFFRPPAEAIREAYKRRAAEIAYIEQAGEAP